MDRLLFANVNNKKKEEKKVKKSIDNINQENRKVGKKKDRDYFFSNSCVWFGI